MRQNNRPTLRLAAAILAVAILTLFVEIVVAGYFFPVTQFQFNERNAVVVFERTCSSCHALTAGQNSYGPSLAKIGSEAATRKPGVSAEEYVFESIVTPNAYRHQTQYGEMPANIAVGLSSEDLFDLTAFLISHGTSPNYHQLVQLVKKSPAAKQESKVRLNIATIEKGRELFYGNLKCAECHDPNEPPGKKLMAPSLVGVGSYDRESLRKSIVAPSHQIKEFYRTTRVINLDGLVFTGRRLARPEGRIALYIADPVDGFRIVEFSVDDLEPFDDGSYFQTIETSDMPEQVLSEDQLTAILAFLTTL